MKYNVKNYDDLSEAIDRYDDVITVEMGQLRDIHGAGKLGNIVVAGIIEKLDGLGLGHSPKGLSTTQWHRAIIYRKGTPVARAIDAVNDARDESDDILREFAGKGGTASEVLQKVRELVCD